MIRRIKRGYVKANLIFYDVETKTVDNELVFRLGVVTAENISFTCYDKEVFTETIISMCEKNKQNYIIAHNAQFDFALLNHVRFSLTCELCNFSTNPFLIHYKLKDENKHVTNFVFLDSMSFFKSSLDDLGKMFSEQKQIIDVLRDRFETEIGEYCKQDTIVLSKIMNFIDEQCIKFDIRFPVTFAQMSFSIYRRHFLKQKLVNPQIEDIVKLERESYFGGRVEAFNFKVHEKVKVNDINSLYPFVMENNYFPVKIKKYFSENVCYSNQSKALDKLFRCIDDKLLVIAKVYVNIPEMYISPIPKRIDEKLVFPNGTFVTTLCSPELELVRDNILHVLEFAVYEKKRIFADFVTTMYNARMRYEKKHPLNLFFKLVMNSLYGKFAQRKFVFERKEDYDDLMIFGRTDFRNGEQFISLDFFEGQAYHRDIQDLNAKSFVAISSFVTSYARVYLYNFLVKYQDNLIYCDTDSMILNTDLDEVLSEKLGDWKEENTFTDFQVLGNKHYQSNEIRKVKGVPNFARVLDNYTFEFEKITKIRESIVRFNRPQPHIITMKKVYNDTYTKRLVQVDLTTLPIVIQESQIVSSLLT